MIASQECPPNGVENAAIFVDAEQLVGSRNGVKVGFFPVVDKSIGFPNPFQHFDT